jgi:hypothetical protein
MTEAAEDRCWNCGMVPKRWLPVPSPVLDEERLLCSNCFARTTRPRISYGWPRSPSGDWADDDEDETPDTALESVTDRLSVADRGSHVNFSVLTVVVAACVFAIIVIGFIMLAERF